jgi:hypothetical protein
MPKAAKRLGFEDLHPTIVANQLFEHLSPGSKVAIVTYMTATTGTGGSNSRSHRHHHLNETHVYPYVQALQARGLVVRVVTPILATTGRGRRVDGAKIYDSSMTTDLHDFCFLLQTRKELVGMAKSTFLFWAAVLGRAQRVRLYSIDSDATRKIAAAQQQQQHDDIFLHYNWTHPDLKRRIHFELYHQEQEQQ